jgi:hypothetical protein
MKNDGQTKLQHKIATLQGCVRQVSLRELAQRILARGRNLNSHPEGLQNKQQSK